MIDGIHVAPWVYGGWMVRRSGVSDPYLTRVSQEEAMAMGRRLALEAKCCLYIHRANGRIHDRVDYRHVK